MDGKWIEADDKEYKIYKNDFFSIDSQKKILKVFKDITYLFLNPKRPPKQILCEVNGQSELYIDMFLKRNLIGPGTYDMKKDAFILTPHGLILVTFPESEKSEKRLSVQDMNAWHDQSLLPIYNFFASTSLNSEPKNPVLEHGAELIL
jgi:hypothetical protein